MERRSPKSEVVSLNLAGCANDFNMLGEVF